MAHLDLWLLNHQLQLISPDTATPKAINCCMQMLESAAKKAGALAMERHDVSRFEAACAAAKGQIKAAAGLRALGVAQKYQLPPAEELLGGCEHLGTWRSPKGVIPPAYEVHAEGGGLAAARKRAENNLGSLMVLEEGKPLGEALQLLLLLFKQQQQQGGYGSAGVAAAGGDVAFLLALRAVEQELFSRAIAGFTTGRLDDEKEVQLLEDVVDAYRKASQDFISSKASEAFMKVELRSRELLVVWVAYCMQFEAVRTMCPLAAEYGVSLDYKDLRHLVLSDRSAVDATLAVAAYLSQQEKPGKDLFSLRGGGEATFRFAEEFAKQDQRMMEVWQQEERDADARVENHWKEVKRKQKLAAELREKLTQLRAEYSLLSASAVSLYSKLSHIQSPQYYSARREASSKQSEADKTEPKLKAAEQAPAPVIQPLPHDKARALQWVFFLYMPPVLRCLSRSSFLARQLLVAPPENPGQAVESTKVEAFKSSMSEHYTIHQKSSYHSPSSSRTGAEGRVLLRSYDEPPEPKDVGEFCLEEASIT
jgi:hypothetical protein